MTDKTPPNTWSANGKEDPHKGKYDCERHELAMGHMTDDQLANGAFMNYDQPLNLEGIMLGTHHSPIAWMTGVKDRIRWLSRRVMKLEQKNHNLVHALMVIQEEVWPLVHGLTCRQTLKNFMRSLGSVIEGNAEQMPVSDFPEAYLAVSKADPGMKSVYLANPTAVNRELFDVFELSVHRVPHWTDNHILWQGSEWVGYDEAGLELIRNAERDKVRDALVVYEATTLRNGGDSLTLPVPKVTVKKLCTVLTEVQQEQAESLLLELLALRYKHGETSSEEARDET